MAYRGTESPMEFEWQGHGPLDPSSPFHRHIMEAQNKKRTYGDFNSPKKPPLPSLREPNNQPFFFSNAPSSPPAAASPFRAPSFTTPRKPFDIDFSSGPENSSPLAPTDCDETPDAKPMPVEFKASPSKTDNKRNSLFNIYGRFAPSPGRGEIRKPASDAIARRIHKKRRRAQKFDKSMVVRKDSTDDSDDDGRPSSSGSKVAVEPVGWMTGLFNFIHTYPDAPSIIAKYLQVFFNAAILGGCLFMLWSFYATIKADVDRASEDAMAEVHSEIAACSKNYVDNLCGAATRLPALENACNNWELCMNRDAAAVRRARLSAHTFAEIFNSFVEPISLKTMLFTTMLVVIGLIVNNATFTLYRRQQEQHNNAGVFRPPSGTYMHPSQYAAHMGQFAASPGLPYGQQPYLGWHGEQGYENRPQGYQRSPSKEHRARSRSPEKKALMG